MREGHGIGVGGHREEFVVSLLIEDPAAIALCISISELQHIVTCGPLCNMCFSAAYSIYDCLTLLLTHRSMFFELLTSWQNAYTVCAWWY